MVGIDWEWVMVSGLRESICSAVDEDIVVRPDPGKLGQSLDHMHVMMSEMFTTSYLVTTLFSAGSDKVAQHSDESARQERCSFREKPHKARINLP